MNRNDSILHINFSTANFAVCYLTKTLKNATRKILSKTFRIIKIGWKLSELERFKGAFAQMSCTLLSIKRMVWHFGEKKLKILEKKSSGFFCCKAKGLKRSKTATSKFFLTQKIFETHKNCSKCYIICNKICTNSLQNGPKFTKPPILVTNFEIFPSEKKFGSCCFWAFQTLSFATTKKQKIFFQVFLIFFHQNVKPSS